VFEESQVVDKLDNMSVEFFPRKFLGPLIRKGARALDLPLNSFSGMNEERTQESGGIRAGKFLKLPFHQSLWFSRLFIAFSEGCISFASVSGLVWGE